MSAPAIREARRADLEAIVALLQDDALGSGREGATADPCYEEAFAAIDADPRHELLVMEENGVVIGCLQLSYLPGLSRKGAWRAQIESVRIAKQRRGQGLGRAFFENAIARAKSRGCALVQLTTDKSRTDALPFYESLGFRATHEGMKMELFWRKI